MMIYGVFSKHQILTTVSVFILLLSLLMWENFVFAAQNTGPAVEISNDVAGATTGVSFSFPSRARFAMIEFTLPGDFDLSLAAVTRNQAGDYASVVCTRYDEEVQRVYGLAVRDVQVVGQAIRFVFALEGVGLAGGGTITCGPVSGVRNPSRTGQTGSFTLRVLNAEGSVVQSFDDIPGVIINADESPSEMTSDTIVRPSFKKVPTSVQNPFILLFQLFLDFARQR